MKSSQGRMKSKILSMLIRSSVGRCWLLCLHYLFCITNNIFLNHIQNYSLSEYYCTLVFQQASHSSCLCTCPSWAHLRVCWDDWVLFNRLDQEPTCWTSQGKCITCWKWVLGFYRVHKYTYTDVWYTSMHTHTNFCCLVLNYLNYLRPLCKGPFTFIWIDYSVLLNQCISSLLVVDVCLYYEHWQQCACHC